MTQQASHAPNLPPPHPKIIKKLQSSHKIPIPSNNTLHITANSAKLRNESIISNSHDKFTRDSLRQDVQLHSLNHSTINSTTSATHSPTSQPTPAHSTLSQIPGTVLTQEPCASIIKLLNISVSQLGNYNDDSIISTNLCRMGIAYLLNDMIMHCTEEHHVASLDKFWNILMPGTRRSDSGIRQMSIEHRDRVMHVNTEFRKNLNDVFRHLITTQFSSRVAQKLLKVDFVMLTVCWATIKFAILRCKSAAFWSGCDLSDHQACIEGVFDKVLSETAPSLQVALPRAAEDIYPKKPKQSTSANTVDLDGEYVPQTDSAQDDSMNDTPVEREEPVNPPSKLECIQKGIIIRYSAEHTKGEPTLTTKALTALFYSDDTYLHTKRWKATKRIRKYMHLSKEYQHLKVHGGKGGKLGLYSLSDALNYYGTKTITSAQLTEAVEAARKNNRSLHAGIGGEKKKKRKRPRERDNAASTTPPRKKDRRSEPSEKKMVSGHTERLSEAGMPTKSTSISASLIGTIQGQIRDLTMERDTLNAEIHELENALQKLQQLQ